MSSIKSKIYGPLFTVCCNGGVNVDGARELIKQANAKHALNGLSPEGISCLFAAVRSRNAMLVELLVSIFSLFFCVVFSFLHI